MSNELHDLSGVNAHMDATVATEATAVTAEVTAGISIIHGTVAAAYHIPYAAMTGAASNNRVITVYNRGASGTGTTALATITYTGSILGTAFVAQAMTLGADTNVAKGDLIDVVTGVNGTGLPGVAGKIQINLQGA